MKFEWDPAKDSTNQSAHGVSFEDAKQVFLDPWLMETSTARVEDNEAREKAMGAVAGQLFTVVVVRRGETIRIISARRANQKERREYGPIH